MVLESRTATIIHCTEAAHGRTGQGEAAQHLNTRLGGASLLKNTSKGLGVRGNWPQGGKMETGMGNMGVRSIFQTLHGACAQIPHLSWNVGKEGAEEQPKVSKTTTLQ